jgi:hypothetical protein
MREGHKHRNRVAAGDPSARPNTEKEASMPSLFPLQANSSTRALVEPHAAAIEAVCSAMEAAGVGVDRVAEIVSGGQSSTLALRGSTEEAQFRTA